MSNYRVIFLEIVDKVSSYFTKLKIIFFSDNVVFIVEVIEVYNNKTSETLTSNKFVLATIIGIIV